MSGPDVTYLVNVYQRSQGADKSKEQLVRREIWYFKKAALDSLNVDRGTFGNPLIRPLPSGLPSDFNWSGKMFGMSSELPYHTNSFFRVGANLSTDAVLDPKFVTLRIGLIDKSDQIPADKCCRQHQNTAIANDPLPVGYAGYYANDQKTGQLPSWGILIPVFRPLINLPIILHEVPAFGGGAETVYRCAYYISTADRPKRHTDNIKQLMASQKRFALASSSENPPPLSIEPDAQSDAQGDFVNVESVDSFDDMLDNYISKDDDAQWTGVLFPGAPDPGQEPPQVGADETDVTAKDQEGD